MDVVAKCGAHHVFNHNHKWYVKNMMDAVGGAGFDVIIEHLANINLGHDVQMLKEGIILSAQRAELLTGTYALCIGYT